VGDAKRMLPRLLSRWNVASRKAAEAMVHGGRVTVDGRVVRDVLAMVRDNARVCVDGEPVGPSEAAVWWALNKPRGVLTTTHDPEGRPTVMGLLPAAPRGLAPVGRLDKDSAGLLLLTNEHALAAALLAPERHVAKVYRVKVEGHPTEATLHAWRSDSLLDRGERLGPMGVDVVRAEPRSTWLRVTLREGKNRQIRRRVAAADHPVVTLIREAFGPVQLGELAPGACRPLTPEEIRALRAAAGASSPPQR
jgi:23S rRNA pseudouridine2605 synthase